MFHPYTNRIKEIAKSFQPEITHLESLLTGNFNTYIDYANVRPWADKLGWHVDTKRLMQFLKSFGLAIFDIFHLKEFICWKREFAYKRTKDPVSEAL